MMELLVLGCVVVSTLVIVSLLRDRASRRDRMSARERKVEALKAKIAAREKAEADAESADKI